MRWSEIVNEAVTPKDVVIIYDNDERSILEIGGRRLVNHDHGFEHTLKGINLKNVRSPHGPLLFHGSIAGNITRFDHSPWFSAEPYTAVTHAEFWKGLSMGKDAFIYVCCARIENPFYDPDIAPGMEKPGEIHQFYKDHPEIDSIIWRNTKDVIMPKTDLYNIKSGDQVEILKKWSIETVEVSDEEFERLVNGRDLNEPYKPDPRVVDNAKWIVIDPGLTPTDAGDQITQDEYEEYKEYGLTAKPI